MNEWTFKCCNICLGPIIAKYLETLDVSSCVAATHNDNIKEFAERHQLQCTLQCLPDPLSTYDVPSKV